jgi:hypothetical protein
MQAIFVALLGAALSLCAATSEFEFADPDQAPSSRATQEKPSATANPSALGPAELVHSSVDAATGLHTDTFIKKLGYLTPGRTETLNLNNPKISKPYNLIPNCLKPLP